MPWVRPLTFAVCCAYPLANHAAAILGEPRYAAVGIALVAGVFALGWLRAGAAALAFAAMLALSLWLAARFPGVLLYTPPIRRVRYRHRPHVSPWQMVTRLSNYKLLPRSSGEASRLP